MKLNKIICGDALEELKKLPDESIDMVLTDPPYGITACNWDKTPDLEKLWIELKRIGKDNCVYVFTATQPFTTDLINSNRKWFKYEWIWDKRLPSGFQIAKYRPMMRHENILVFSKRTPRYIPVMTEQKPRKGGGFKISSNSSPIKNVDGKLRNYTKKYPQSILEFYKRDKKTIHPTQKPIALMEYLIKTYSNENDLILDPFIGSGTTAVVAKMSDRNYIGIENNPEYVKITNERINSVPQRLL